MKLEINVKTSSPGVYLNCSPYGEKSKDFVTTSFLKDDLLNLCGDMSVALIFESFGKYLKVPVLTLLVDYEKNMMVFFSQFKENHLQKNRPEKKYKSGVKTCDMKLQVQPIIC